MKRHLICHSCVSLSLLVIVCLSGCMKVDAGPDKTIPEGESCVLEGSASGGLEPYTYSWSPATGLDNPNVAQPTASPEETTEYTLTVTDSLGQMAKDTATVNVQHFNPLVQGQYVYVGQEFGPMLIRGLLWTFTKLTFAQVRATHPDGQQTTLIPVDDFLGPHYVVYVDRQHVLDACYEFAGMDESGDPVPGAAGQAMLSSDHAVPDPPRDVQLSIEDPDLVVTWSPVSPTVPYFDPENGVGSYVIELLELEYISAVPRIVYLWSGGAPQAEIPLDDLWELSPGRYLVLAVSLTESDDHHGQVFSLDAMEIRCLTITEDRELILGCFHTDVNAGYQYAGEGSTPMVGTWLSVLTDMSVTEALATVPDGEEVTLEPSQDVSALLPGFFRFATGVPGEPVRDEWYTFIGLDATGNPIDCAEGQDHVTTDPVDPPRGVRAVLSGEEIIITWDAVAPNGTTFEPTQGVGFYQIEVYGPAESEAPAMVYLRNFLPTPEVAIPLTDLDALSPGQYHVDVISFTMLDGNIETNSRDNAEQIRFAVDQNGDITLGNGS